MPTEALEPESRVDVQGPETTRRPPGFTSVRGICRLAGDPSASSPSLPGMSTMTKDEYKPGEVAPVSGQYEVVGPRGGHTGLEITGVKGKRLPPTQHPGEKYRLVDRTKHKGKP